jgi:hypothetical protein
MARRLAVTMTLQVEGRTSDPSDLMTGGTCNYAVTLGFRAHLEGSSPRSTGRWHGSWWVDEAWSALPGSVALNAPIPPGGLGGGLIDQPREVVLG